MKAVLFQDWGVGDPSRVVDVYTLTRDGQYFFSGFRTFEVVAEGTEDVFEGAEPWEPVETKIVVGSFIAAAITLVIFGYLIHVYILG